MEEGVRFKNDLHWKKDKTWGPFIPPSPTICLSVYLCTVAWIWARALTRTKQLEAVREMRLLAIWVTSSSYFCPIDCFRNKCSHSGDLTECDVCCLLEPKKKWIRLFQIQSFVIRILKQNRHRSLKHEARSSLQARCDANASVVFNIAYARTRFYVKATPSTEMAFDVTMTICTLVLLRISMGF